MKKQQKEIKIIRVSEDVCVACGRIFDKYGVGTLRPDGGFETKKSESKLYDEDEINAMFGNL